MDKTSRQSKTPLDAHFLSYWMREDAEHIVGFDLPLSEVYRSSYLRAIAWAVDCGFLELTQGQFLSAKTCPIDFGLWRAVPGARPIDWPEVAESGDSVDSAPGSVAAAVCALWNHHIADDWSVGIQRGLVFEGENVAYDLKIIGVIQTCAGPEVPDGASLCAGPPVYISEVSRSLVEFGGVYHKEPPSKMVERAGDWRLWRLAAKADLNTAPRWQWWRLWRGIWLPSPFLASSAFSFRCVESGVAVEEDGEEVARWVDWSDGLRELAVANLPPPCGSRLLIRRSVVERCAAALGGSYAWIAKITVFHRKHAYSTFAKATFTLDFGMTRVVRAGGR